MPGHDFNGFYGSSGVPGRHGNAHGECDAANTTSFTGSTNWNPTGAPSPGNSYFTAALVIRPVNNVTTHSTNIFGGDTLSIDLGGRFLCKVGDNIAGDTTLANNTANYILNGGLMDQAGANNDSAVCVIGGMVSVNAASYLGAFGGTSSGSASFETLDIIAPISGSAALQVSGANVNSGGDTGVVILSAANPYNGIITITNANGGIVASTINRILQFDNVNALSNATLNLVATGGVGQLVTDDAWTVGGTFNADSTFYIQPGLATNTEVSFESYSWPGLYIRQNNSLIYAQSGSGPAFNGDATWQPWTASQLLNLQITPTNGNQAAVNWDPTWNGVGTLLQAGGLNGPWLTNSTAVSPFVVMPAATAHFYRVEQ